MHRIWSVLVSCVIPFGGSGFAQALHFDAASVKMVDPISRIGYGTTGGPGTGDPGRIHFRCAMMMELLRSAYDVQADQIVGGPDWVRDQSGSTRYEVLATMPPGTNKQQLQLMLQSLLAERFHLAVHRESRNFPGYLLVVAKGGPKLSAMPAELPGMASGASGPVIDRSGALVFPPRESVQTMSSGRMQTTYKGKAMADFAGDLSNLVAQALGTPSLERLGDTRPRITDKTGLTGKYDFTLEFSCAGCTDMATMMRRLRGDTSADTLPSDPVGGGLPNIFTALEKQLGLRLEKVKDIPLDVVVIDRVNKIPTPN